MKLSLEILREEAKAFCENMRTMHRMRLYLNRLFILPMITRNIKDDIYCLYNAKIV